MYQLKLQDFVYTFPEEDDVLEPGEKGYVINVTIANTGDMPSPIH